MNVRIFCMGLFLLFINFPVTKAATPQQGAAGDLSDDDRVNELIKKWGEAADKGKIVESQQIQNKIHAIQSNPDPNPMPSTPIKKALSASQQSYPMARGSDTGCKSHQLSSTLAKCEDLFKTTERKNKLPPADDPSNHSQSGGASRINNSGKR